jgi:glycerol-3-phosphate acyltransferase PlsY
MPAVLIPLGVALLAYLVGCFSTGYYLVRLRTGQDLRTIGSGATGGRNVARILGPAGFLLTGAGDLAKSVIAVGVPIWLSLGPVEVGAAMVGVAAGHVWPFQLGFKGGKGVAPFVGTMAVVAPVALVAGAIIAAVLVVATRRPHIGGLTGLALTPAIASALGAPIPLVVAILGIVAIALVAHRANIRAELATTPSWRLPAWPVQRGRSADG